MSEPGETLLRSWSSDYADVRLIQNPSGDRRIRKRYRRPFYVYYLREVLAMKRLARLSVVPPLLRVNWKKMELEIAWQKGPTVLEWILERHGSSEGPGSANTDPSSQRSREALQRFRESRDPLDETLRGAILDAYAELHAIHFMHGDPGPQNLIYHEERVYLVDFDHGRPSADPGYLDNPQLASVYGVTPPSRNLGPLGRLLARIEDLARG